MIDGTLETIDGRPALRFERRLAHPVARVWRAVTEPAELAQWFVAPVAWTPALGETFEGGGQRGEIVALEAPTLLRWTWGDERYSFELEPLGDSDSESAGDGCRLVFTHVFDDRYGPAAQHAAGWATYLDRLDALLAGGALSEEDAHDIIGELHERYAAAFGQDPAPGRRMIASLGFRGLTLEEHHHDRGAGGRVRLRLERRYRHPVARVWRAISDADELAHWFPSNEPMHVVEADPPHRLRATWFGDELRFDLRTEGEGCVLVFTHAFEDRDVSARTAAGWDRCFARLDALFAGRPMDEAVSLELWPEVHERYAERLQVDPEIGRSAYAAHPLT
jgi:uncharacterized protein YndB with AHSA1/START domain